MAQPLLKLTLKKLTINTRRVQSAERRMKRRAYSRIGGLVRTIARRSIRFRKNRSIQSRPGNPPITHTRGFGIKTIMWSSTEFNVIIGPVRFSKPGFATRTLEFGGLSRFRRFGRRMGGHYRARPTMGPALEKGRPRFASFYQGGFR